MASTSDELAWAQAATLRKLRQRKNLTLRVVSNGANIALGFLSEIETGQKNTTPQTLGSLLDFYGLTVDDWLKEQHFTLIGKEQGDSNE